MYPESVVGVRSCFLEFVMGVDIYGIVVVVLGSSKIKNNVQCGENVRQHNTFALYTHSSNDGDGVILHNFEKIETLRTFLKL